MFTQKIFASLLLVLFSSPISSRAEDVTVRFLPDGVTARVGGYRPLRAEMDLEAAIATDVPDGLEAPKFGKFELNDKSWVFILDEPTEGSPKLFVDTNGDGNLTNDPATTWESQQQGDTTMCRGTCTVDLGAGNIGSLGLYRFDPTDERRAALKNTLMYYFDFGFEYTFKLDDQELSGFVAGYPTNETRMPVDRDGNGSISHNFENVMIGSPFNFTGTTAVFTYADGKLTLDKSAETLPMMPLPPNLKVGQTALEFSATTIGAETIEFPSRYAGKIVMLDFWATWCGPCIGEIPHMKAAYDEWHEQGFEILGISLDSEDMTDKINEFLKEKEIPWPQIYDGLGWKAELAYRYDVSGIPFVLLVDGDSGKILANARSLRGEGLSKFIGEKIKEKTGSSPNYP